MIIEVKQQWITNLLTYYTEDNLQEFVLKALGEALASGDTFPIYVLAPAVRTSNPILDTNEGTHA